MQAYFTASIAGKKHYLKHYLAIIDYLKSKGITVLSDHIIKAEEATISLETKAERLAFHKKLESWIDNADFMIVEATFPSISVGYEISLAVHKGKPVLALYSQGDPPSLIFNNEEDKIVCEKYTEHNLHEIINDFINYVRGGSDTRFTFFVSSDITSYLSKMAKKNKVPKSVYLRYLIQQDMRKSK